MKVVVGLGNPGSEYQHTRHNLGFMVLDAFADAHNIAWQPKDKFRAKVAESVIDGQKVILIKPATFYNDSGVAAQAITAFYKINPADILVIHDELALPFGAIRTRLGGSDAGNNGIKSIIAAVGDGFARIRIGIANDHSARQDAADFVLSRLSATEAEQLPAIKKHATQYVDAFLDGSFDHTTHKI